MKYCFHCRKELADDARFCDGCGTSTDDTVLLEEEKAFLIQTQRFLKSERLCWKIFGIIWLVFASLFIGLSLLFLALSTQMNFKNGQIGMAVAFGIYVVCGLILLAVAIVNLVMVKKASVYRDGITADPRAALSRCGSIGPLVLSVFFNEIALIFVIINFVRIKSHAATVRRIHERFSRQ